MDVMQTIKDILEENLDIDPETVTAESTLEDLGIDSLDTVELICDLEERCEIEMGYPEGLNTIGDVVSYIENL
jgi:acyl carrier protein